MIYHAETLQFQVLTVDQFTHTPGLFSVKGRSYAALSFRFCGEGAFSVDGTQFLSRPNDVLFLPAGVDYQVRYTHGVSIVVHLLDCNYTITEQIPQVPFLSAAFTDLLTDWKTQRQVNAVKSGVYGILAALAKRQSAAASQEIAPALAYLQANHTKPHLSVEEAARGAYEPIHLTTGICRVSGHFSETICGRSATGRSRPLAFTRTFRKGSCRKMRICG